MSGRFPRAISRTSRKPFVVTSAVRTPLRSVMALMTVVPPCTKKDTARGSIPERSMVSSTPWVRSRGVLSDFAASRLPLSSSK